MMPKSDQAHPTSGLVAHTSLLRRIGTLALDLVFPPMCHGCGRVDYEWCPQCTLELEAVPIIPRVIPSDALTGLCATGKHERLLQQALQALKYNNQRGLGKPLGERLVTTLPQLNWTFDTIIPVPLFADRLQKRGYNQSYILSQQIEYAMQVPSEPDWLQRYRDTNQQVGLNAQERKENVKDAFIATSDVAGKSILLIDDVVTTGSTIEACATALFEAGSIRVYAITVSHA